MPRMWRGKQEVRKTEIAMVDCLERDIKEREKNRDKEQQREGPGDC